MTKVSIVVPCYNEQEMLPIFLEKTNEFFVNNEKYSYDFIFVNDGSKDKTLDILKEAAEKRDDISYLNLSHNFGQDPALAAGIKIATGDVVIPMDCDLQDPPELVVKMLEKYEEGYDVVNPQRVKRETDTFFKKKTAGMFYKFINKVAGSKVMPENVSMYRLLSRRVVDHLNALPEASRVLRSEVPFVGFKTTYIGFERGERAAGQTKYNFNKLFELACHTIASSTSKFLNYVLKFGMGFTIVGFLGLLTSLICFIVYQAQNPLNPQDMINVSEAINSSMVGIIISTGVLVVGCVLIVLYIPTIYLKEIQANTQNRPTYIVQERFDSVKSVKNTKKVE